MFGLDLFEVLVILVVALVVVGPRRLPELARTIGKTMRDLRRASNDLRRSLDEAIAEPPPGRPLPPKNVSELPPGTRGPNPTVAVAVARSDPYAEPERASEPRPPAPKPSEPKDG